MNKHSNHTDYICKKARNAMGLGAIGYFGKYSIHQPLHLLLEDLICEWHNLNMFIDPRKRAYAGKCRNVAIRLIERNGGYKRTLAALKKNSAWKAWSEFCHERF